MYQIQIASIPFYFNNQLVWVLISVGTVYFLVGRLMKNHHPPDINGLAGYRTSRSMKNQECWDFAQLIAGKKMSQFGKTGILIGLISIIIPIPDPWDFCLGIIWVLLSCSILIYSVEKSLKRKFGK
ncbi:MAG: putative membrane protein [Algoriphagus sp.]|jgi:uncharacterized membrane protein